SNVDLVWHWGIVSREIVLAVWVAVAALISLYLLGLLRLMHDGKNDAIKSTRLLVSLIFLSLAFWLLPDCLVRAWEKLNRFSRQQLRSHQAPSH
ncbi:MAG TPA: hypothetical protein VLQ90_05055, partial [Pyrinomonadaceae bacterium]|nr:hypothetical protein [Pyrinomonadaceae bacterium]